VQAVLTAAGLLDGQAPGEAPRFTGRDGSPGWITRHAKVVADRLPGPAEPVLLQVSRWDRLKDMAGVLDAFARYVAPRVEGTLALVGPMVDDVTDDPEGAQVYAECLRQWQQTPAPIRARIMIAALPMDDVDENAVVVNALQRHATVVTQKSLAEGFGLTVAEAMWKGRAVIGSAVGGIPDQIAAGTGLLLHDPSDLPTFGDQVRRLLADEALRNDLGAAARERVREHFLGDLHLRRYAAMFGTLSAA
jgi:trehalose synthase